MLGATGLVGDTMIRVLEERDFPVSELFPLASSRSLGKRVEFRGRHIPVIDVATFDFSRAQIGLFSAGGEVSREYAPKAAAAGCIVIDNTSEFRYEDDIPLVVPEVNPARHRASTGSATSSPIPIARPSRWWWRSSRSTTPWASRASTWPPINPCRAPARKRWTSWPRRRPALMSGEEPGKPQVIAKHIAFNCVPQIDKFMDNGYTKEEMKMVWETRKIMGDPSILVNATAVRVPVFFGHSEAVHIETRQKITAEAARDLLTQVPGNGGVR